MDVFMHISLKPRHAWGFLLLAVYRRNFADTSLVRIEQQLSQGDENNDADDRRRGIGGDQRAPRFAERELWNVPRILGSLRLDAGGFDHLAPLLGFVDDQLFKVGGRARQRRTTHSGVGKRGVDLLSTDKGKPPGPW